MSSKLLGELLAIDDPFRRLVKLIAILRDDEGCPWDQEQTLASVRAYLLEEAHETAAAIDSRSWTELHEELGDLLFQVAFVSQLAAEQQQFDLARVANDVVEKMIERHPHVFATEQLSTSVEVARAWEQRKQRSRDDSQASDLLAGVPNTLPALVAAFRISQKAAAVGFDWPDAHAVFEKVQEELEEVRQAAAAPRPPTSRTFTTQGAQNHPQLEEEIGDLLHAIVSLSRHLEVDPERALALANQKFRRRFRSIERNMGSRMTDSSVPLEQRRQEMEDLWDRKKALDRGDS